MLVHLSTFISCQPLLLPTLRDAKPYMYHIFRHLATWHCPDPISILYIICQLHALAYSAASSKNILPACVGLQAVTHNFSVRLKVTPHVPGYPFLWTQQNLGLSFPATCRVLDVKFHGVHPIDNYHISHVSFTSLKARIQSCSFVNLQDPRPLAMAAT